MGLGSMALLHAPAVAQGWTPGVRAWAHHAIDGFNYSGLNLPLYSEEWMGGVSDGHGVVSLSHALGEVPPEGTACLDAPWGCNGASVEVTADEAAGTLKLHASNGNSGFVMTGDDTGNRGVTNRTPDVYVQIDDQIILSAPATVTLRGHLKGSVSGTWYGPDPECGSDVRSGTTVGFYQPDPYGWPAWMGKYERTFRWKGSINEAFAVQVDLPAGATYFRALMSGSVNAESHASNYPSYGYVDSCSESTYIRFGDGLVYEIAVPYGVEATSTSGLLPIVYVGAPDTTPPETVAVVWPNEAGWNNRDVIVTLMATDNPGGSGVKEITYSATGAQWIDATTVANQSAGFYVTAEGGTTIAYFATDNEGNRETTKTQLVLIDKTAPTGSILINDGAASTDTASVTLGLTGDDGGSGVSLMRFADTVEGLASATWVAFAASSPYTLAGAEGTQTVYAQFQDTAGHLSDVYSDDIEMIATLDTMPPAIIVSPADLAVVPVGTAITFSAQDTESGVAPGFPTGSLDDGATITTVSSGYMPPAGVYTLVVTAEDIAGNEASQTVRFTVYDPAGGFASGSGSIDSPAGAYRADASVTGRAHFGFVSRYDKGATVPTGRTAFQFRVANLDFRGTSLEWLVVNKAGNSAQFKGAGLINGQQAPDGQDFKFQIWATDGSPDTFRIKIWYEQPSGSTVIERVVYDNGTQQAIAAGNIIVRAK
jgi:hypothetical protein